MFRGITALVVDAKGRMALPARYRDRLHQDGEGNVVITIDTEAPCLLLYPLKEWEVIESKLSALPSFNTAARRIQRLLIGHATECELDGQGRVLIPSLLRDYATLDKKIMLVGQGQKLELWNEKNWEEYRQVCLASDVRRSHDLPDEVKELSL